MKIVTLVLLPLALLVGLISLNVRWLKMPIDLTPLATHAVADKALTDTATDTDGETGILALDSGEALRRPLFHADRRPFSPPPAEPIAVETAEAEPPPPVTEPERPTPAPELRLAGVSLAGDQRLALLGPISSTDVRWYAEGQAIEGWTLSAISGQAVHLKLGDRSVSFKLYPGAQP